MTSDYDISLTPPPPLVADSDEDAGVSLLVCARLRAHTHASVAATGPRDEPVGCRTGGGGGGTAAAHVPQSGLRPLRVACLSARAVRFMLPDARGHDANVRPAHATPRNGGAVNCIQ